MAYPARHWLSENLKALMAARPTLGTFAKITAAGGPTNGTLDRIRRQTAGVSVDQTDLLAAVFGLETWQLLVPNLQPNNPPIVLGAGGETERYLWAKIEALGAQNAELRSGGTTRPGALTLHEPTSPYDTPKSAEK